MPVNLCILPFQPHCLLPSQYLISCLRASTTLSPTCDCWSSGLSLDSRPVQNMGSWSVCEPALKSELASSGQDDFYLVGQVFFLLLPPDSWARRRNH